MNKMNNINLKNWTGELIRQAVLFPVVNFFTGLKTSGQSRLSELRTSFILVANHSSHVDTLALLTALPLQVRLKMRVAAAADYFFTKSWKSLLMQTVINAFPFVRKGEESLQQSRELLEQGESLLLFPEGTRSPDGLLHSFKRGVGRLAIESGKPVVPAYIAGAYEVLPKGAKWPRRHPVKITFGKPLYFTPNSNPAQVAECLEQAVAELAAETSYQKAA